MAPRRTAALIATSCTAVLGLSLGLSLDSDAQARQKVKIPVAEFDQMMFEQPMQQRGAIAVAQFRLTDMPLGGPAAPTSVPHIGSHGGTLTSDAHGMLVLDRELGQLLRTDADGEVLASMDFERGAGELVSDGAGALYIADRMAHRVVRVNAHADHFERVDGAALREPHGLALSPNGATLYVTSVADHELVAFDTATMSPRWRLELAAEPRGVAVSSDGRKAIVGFLTSGVLAQVELAAHPSVEYLSLDPAQRVEADPFAQGFALGNAAPSQQAAPPNAALRAPGSGHPSLSDTRDIGLQFARNSYGVAFIGNDIAVAPHQLSTPHLPSTGFENEGTYGGGGGFTAPIIHRMAMIEGEHSLAPAMAFAEIGLHQPRAITYDGASDTLYLAGYGNDQVMAIADVSRASVHLAWATGLLSQSGTCAPDGLTLHDGQLYAHCELDRSLVRVDVQAAATGVIETKLLPTLGASPHSAAAQRGAALFRRGFDQRISVGGFMACSSCHPEARTDGLSWRIEGHNLQTPLLAGRVAGTQPFKWDGHDKDLPTSLVNTVGRLGGFGLSVSDAADLQAFLESLPAPLPPSTANPDALGRGRELFASGETGCVACHDGPQLADGMQHELASNIGKVDTPSLIGLAHTAPYYHDGSARTLRALLADKGSIHDMGETAHLSSAQIDDLVVYLESL